MSAARSSRGLRVAFVGATLTAVLLATTVNANATADERLLVTVDTGGHPAVSAIVTSPHAVQGAPLGSTAFSVREAGRNPAVTVQRIPTGSLEIVLAIDTSGSMKGAAIQRAVDAASEFVASMPPDVRLGLIHFGQSSVVDSTFTADHASIQRRLRGLKARGETALFDAVALSASLFPTPVPTGRRAIVLVTDGRDTVSQSKLSAVARMVQDAGINVYAVSLETAESDLSSLRVLTGGDGGRIVAAADPDELQKVFQSIAGDVINQYRLTWDSTAHGRTPVEISLTFAGTTYRSLQDVDYPAPLTVPSVPTGPSSSPSAVAVAPPLVRLAPGTSNDGRIALVVGAALAFVALFVLGLFVFWPTKPMRHLARELMPTLRAGPHLGITKKAVEIADSVLRSGDRGNRISRLLEAAGLSILPAEVVVMVVVTSAVGFLVGLAFLGFVGGLLLAATVVAGLVVLLRIRIQRRRAKFAEQLESTLELMATSLRAGYGVSQALTTVARESASPTADEFRRAILETTIGKDQLLALRDVADRAENEDLRWVIDAMEINREVGGNLGEVFKNVAQTIRERSRIRRQVKALSAEGRISGWILGALPLILFVYMLKVNREYMDELLTTQKGHVFLGVGAGLFVMGTISMIRIARVEY